MNRRKRVAATIAAGTAGLLFYGAYLYRHTCFAVGGSDSSGYANAARAITEGPLVWPVSALDRLALPDDATHLFTPLGYVALSDRRAIAPVYPIGFPLHLAAAGIVFGWKTAPYLVSPLAALLCLALTYAIGRQLGLSDLAAGCGALLLASSPLLVFQAVQPMSDVVATLWCLAAVWAALWSRRRPGVAAAAGFAFGVAVLVRPLDALLAVPLLFALAPRRKAYLAFLLGGLPCAVLLFAYDAAAFGSPFQTGYGAAGIGGLFSAKNFSVQAPRYLAWSLRVLTPLVALGWAALVADRRVSRRDRAFLFSWFAIFFFAYSFYEPGEDWWYTRFLLPGIPAVLIGAVRLGQDLAALPARPDRRRLAVVAVLVAVLATAVVGFRHARRWGALGFARHQESFPEACRWAAGVVPRDALVISMEMSGALRYYTPLTPVRWDALDAQTFRALVARTDGGAGSWYALLKHGEIAQAEPRVPGRWRHLGDRGDVSLWRLEAVSP